MQGCRCRPVSAKKCRIFRPFFLWIFTGMLRLWNIVYFGPPCLLHPICTFTLYLRLIGSQHMGFCTTDDCQVTMAHYRFQRIQSQMTVDKNLTCPVQLNPSPLKRRNGHTHTHRLKLVFNWRDWQIPTFDIRRSNHPTAGDGAPPHVPCVASSAHIWGLSADDRWRPAAEPSRTSGFLSQLRRRRQGPRSTARRPGHCSHSGCPWMCAGLGSAFHTNYVHYNACVLSGLTLT